MQLPFAVVPLIHFTSDQKRMGAFANKAWVVVLAWVTAAIIVALNLRLLTQSLIEWIGAAGEYRNLIATLVLPAAAGLGALLAWITLQPLFARWGLRFRRAPVTLAEPGNAAADVMVPAHVYHRILVPLDHTRLDRTAMSCGSRGAHTSRQALFISVEGDRPGLW
jgi:manganese transport protein